MMSWCSERSRYNNMHNSSPFSSASRSLEPHSMSKSVEFNKACIKVLCHNIGQTGIHADPEKTKAIREMKTRTTILELRRFMGIVNKLGKLASHLAHLIQPLSGLLSKETTWVWGPNQSNTFIRVKEELSKPTILALYDPQAPTTLS